MRGEGEKREVGRLQGGWSKICSKYCWTASSTPAIEGRKMGCKPDILQTGFAPLGLCLLQQQGYMRGFPALHVRTPPSPCVQSSATWYMQ